MAGKGDSTDLYMKFVLYGYEPTAIEAESTTEFDPGSQPGSKRLVEGFQKKRMFEVDRFTFNVGIEDQEAEVAKKKKGEDRTKGAEQSKLKDHKAGRSTSGQYQAWRAGTVNKPYPADIQPISFTRQIDRASSKLLDSCIHNKIFSSASLIKRRAAGGGTAGLVYLRIDFYDVLIVEMEWSDDDEVTETCKFVCRKVLVQYQPQLPDGSLGAVVPGFWSVNAWDTEKTVRR